MAILNVMEIFLVLIIAGTGVIEGVLQMASESLGGFMRSRAAFFFGNCHTKFENLCYTMPVLRAEGLDNRSFAG